MTDLRYLRGYNTSPYTIDLWDGALQYILNLYGVRFNYTDNPMIDAYKPLKVGMDGYVTTGQINMATEVSVSGDIDWSGHTITNMADAVSLSSPATLRQLDYVSGVLQDEIDAILNDHAWEYTEVVSAVGGKDTFNVSPHTFDPLNTRVDIQVFRNDGRIFQTIDFTKLDDHRIQTTPAIPQNSRLTIRSERTGGAGGSGSPTDLTNIDVNPQPDTDGGRSLGGTKAWDSVILKDKVTGTHYELSVSGGFIIAESL